MGTTGLPSALRQYAASGFSGALRVDGDPGGIVYLAAGGISGCHTPGAPGLDVILLRSGLLAEAEWDAARGAASAAGRDLPAELVGRGLLGMGEAEALLRTALADAMFALLSGQVDGWSEAPRADCLLPLRPAAKPDWLLAEAGRRARVLASLPGPPPGADGRRTARDLAFALGRGFYETMLQLARKRAGTPS